MTEGGEFSGQCVLVTGATGGLGAALCRAFGAAGAGIAALDLDASRLDALRSELEASGVSCASWPCDVTDQQACLQAVDAAAAHFGRLDVVVCNAGISHRSAFAETDLKVIHQVMDVNFWGSVHITHAAISHLRKTRGRIAAISSVAGFAPLIARTAYAASKHAVQGFFNSLRGELQDDGISVTLACPSFVATGIEKNQLGKDGGPVQHAYKTLGKAMLPEAAAAEIVAAINARERIRVIGQLGKLSWLLSRAAPGFYEKQMIRRLRSEMG